ncbi:MAG TPA: hypothetical protein EYN11_04995 [Phycisphaerales bacterium]|jgi:hypothetical protein|nr:hypothetical protein [Phycisphaerales bacterium]HIN84604.1 hypothetical protein [Phycisphaerales bacterium]HIO20436.1 hypothetical protein [Phycisphaerales bacterium]HIO52755.1 hypothetical protein [Phycisphaerales bacterium]
MSTSLVIAVLSILMGSGLVQPICTPRDFHNAFGNSIQGDNEFIAKAIFDDYAEQVQAINSGETENADTTPSQQLAIELQRATEADMLFDELLSSLSVINNDIEWRTSIANLRRSVLLEARKFTNPWPATVWVDVPSITTVPDSVLFQIDTFLLNNIDKDRTERFMASVLQLGGNVLKCKAYEKQSMQRWGEYLDIIAPYIDEEVAAALYPQLNTGEEVQRIANWIYKNSNDTKIHESVSKQLAIWNTIKKKQNETIIQLVINSRKQLGFDPWSRGCGQQTDTAAYKIKNELMQKSAEINEFDKATNNVLLRLLPEELRHSFESEE